MFGNVHFRVEKATAAVDDIQACIDATGLSDAFQKKETLAQIELQQALAAQETFWMDKARLNWFNYGDRNTTYFHKLTKIRNVSKQLSLLKLGESILYSTNAIESHVVDYFSSLYSVNSACVDNGLVEQVIPSLVSIDDNSMLTNLPSMEEVRNAVFSMNNNSALGPDGFGSCFYQTYWDLVGNDVFKSVL